MSKVVSFISRKGGIGKTTTAINLATIMASLGHEVALLETDTNYTLSTLRKMELFKGANKQNIFKILGSTPGSMLQDLETLKAEKNDFILVDSAGRTTDEEIKKLAIASDAIIVPTSLTQNDTLVTYQTVEDLKPARELNPDLKILVLPNRIHSSTRMHTIKDALSQLDAEVLDVMVPQKNLFANFSTILSEKEFLPVAKTIMAALNSN